MPHILDILPTVASKQLLAKSVAFHKLSPCLRLFGWWQTFAWERIWMTEAKVGVDHWREFYMYCAATKMMGNDFSEGSLNMRK